VRTDGETGREGKERKGKSREGSQDFLPRDPDGILERDVARMHGQDVWDDDFDELIRENDPPNDSGC